MSDHHRKFLEMAIALARTVRRGRDLELARAAADREIEWQRELDAASEPVAAGSSSETAPFFSARQ
jgi:hypothetical protein